MTTPIGITLSLDGAPQTEAGLRRVAGSMDSVGISAKQTAAALRGVPAQFTDIITSLQGGQAPLTVFLQQGGQLKDMFGGAGNAAKALGGYVVGLINPFTVAAAAGVALALAYKQGSAEADAYAKSIALTGNAAGVTTGQLQGMAERVSAVVGTQAKAAEVIAQMVGSGGVAAQNIEQFAATAIRMERNVGVAVKDTIKEFAELGKEPVEAAKKLNERYNYLTAAVYEQIKALKEQGKASEAAALSQDAYEKAMATVASTMEGRLGVLERGWRNIADAAKSGWDAMLNVGRPTTMADEMGRIRTLIANKEVGLDSYRETRAGQIVVGEIDALKQKLSVMESDERMVRRGAEAQAARTQAEKDGIAAADALQKTQEKGLGKQQQMNKALEEYRKQLNDLRAVNPNSERLLPDAVSRGERAIRDQFKPSGSGAAGVGQNEVAALRAQADEAERYLEQLRTRGEQAEKLTAGELRARKIREELNTSISGAARAEKELALVQAERLGVAERATVSEKARIKSAAESEAAYRKVLDAIVKSGDAVGAQADQQEAANAAYGKGKVAIEEMALAQQKLAIASEKETGPWDPERIAAMEHAIQQRQRYVDALRGGDGKALNARADEMLRSARELSAVYADEAQLAGLTSLERAKTVALRQVELKYAKELADVDKSSASDDAKQRARDTLNLAKRTEGEAAVAKAIQEDWARTADQINQSLTDALMRGFESGKDFAKNLRDTVINMFKTMVLRPVISAIVNPIAGAVTGMMGLSGAANASTGGGNLLGTALQGTSLYSGLTSGTGVLGSIGSALGFGAGVSSTMGGLGTAAIGSYAAPSVAAMTIAPGATAAAGAGGMSGALAAIPGWGWALAGVAALGMLAKKFDDSGTPHMGAGAVYSAAGGLQDGAGIYNRGTFGMGATGEYAQGTQAGVSTIATGLAQTFDGLAKAFGKTAGYEIATAFADDSSKDGAWGSFRISQGGQDLLNWENDRQSKWAPREFANGEEGYKQYMAEIAKGARTALVTAIGDVSWAKDMLTAIGESASMEQLSATVQQIAAIKTQFVQLGKAMEMFDGISSGMESALLSAAGSIDALTASAAGYYDAVYTEQEKIARSREQLESTLAGYGTSLPATREQYRALVEQQVAAGESGAEFAVVLMGLAGTFAQVADDIESQFAALAKSASDVFSPLLESLKQARADVAGTRAKMLKSDQAMTASQIAAAIGAAMVYEPNTAGVVGAQGGVASASAQLATAKQGQQYWGGMEQQLAGGVAQTQQTISALDAWFGGVQKSFNEFTAYRDWAWSGAGRYSESMALIPENQRRTAQYGIDQASYTSQRQAAEVQLLQQQAALSPVSAEAGRYAQQLAAAQAALKTAQQAEVQARADYAAQINTFVLAAGTSVGKLGSLREEVVRFYEEQAQAVQSMIATAENLRNVVGSIRMGQLDSAQTAAQMGGSYASDYSMALATTGTTRAGYADSMASTLPTLAEALKTEAASASDWRVQTGKLLAQATGVAGMLEADAAGSDYQSVSLGLLGSIDTALAQLEGSTKSAEQVIAQAIKDGTTAQLSGLRAVVAALRGESIPAFATGGMHAGGLRLVGENGPELEATGPSRIFSASQTAAMLSGGGNAELIAEVRALRSEVAGLRAEAQATAGHTSKTARLLDRAMPDGDALATRAAA